MRVDIREVVAEHERLVLETAYRLLGRWEDAQDAAQEVFLKLHRTKDRFDNTRAVSPWLYRITVNTCRDLYRRRRPEHEIRDVPTTSLGPEQAAALEQQRRLLHHAIAALPERERTAIVLRELEGLSTEEVAGRMGSTVETVRSQISKGRVRLRRILAAAAAMLGVAIWILWPRRPELVPPPAVTAKMPTAPLRHSDSRKQPAPIRAARLPKSEPMVVKMLSEDESLIIYWIVDAKEGDEE